MLNISINDLFPIQLVSFNEQDNQIEIHGNINTEIGNFISYLMKQINKSINLYLYTEEKGIQRIKNKILNALTFSLSADNFTIILSTKEL